MRRITDRIRRSALLPAVGANIATQVALAVAQLAVVPAFALHWGAETYGVWLMLFTIPSYLAVADLGLASAAGNDMAAAVAREQRSAAAATYRAVRVAVLAMSGLILAGALLVARADFRWLQEAQAASGGHAGTLFLLVTLYGLLGLQNGVTAAGMRATGGYAAAGSIAAIGFLGEALLALLLLRAGCGLAGVASGYLAVRAVTSLVLAATLARRAPWLVPWRGSERAPLEQLWRPALAAAALPVAQAASLQGTVLVIGLAAGAGAVPAFTAVRTLSRVAIQAILLVNHAVMPSVTVADAVADRRQVAGYAALSHLSACAVAVPGALLLLIAGQPLVRMWTGGALQPSFGLVAAMAATMLLNALWQPASNLLLATNRHERFAWLYAAAALAALALCYPLTRRLGAAGAALSLLVVDATMLWRVGSLSRQFGLLDLRSIVVQLRALTGATRPGRAA